MAVYNALMSSTMLQDTTAHNPGPAEPGYNLPLQTV